MEGTAVKAIAELEDKAKVIEINGRQYTRVDVKPVIEYVARPAAIEGSTLAGLVDYIVKNREDIDLGICMLQVVDHGRVDLLEVFQGDDARRTTYYRAKLDGQLPAFKFDEYLGVEEFIIKARALFQHTADLNAIINIVSRVVAQDEITAKDDGLSQTVQLKKGVSGALSEGVQTQGMYELRPYRTFREIEQPASRFILRLKASDGGLPRVALFDAEGGTWRYTAMQTVKAHIDAALQGVGVPVFA
jgi:hypothetical protein